ncbi:MAG: hypothetical protein ABI581_16350 [Sediminibacterium sp.]
MPNLLQRVIRKLADINFYKNLPRTVGELVKRTYHEKILFKVASKESVFTSIWKNNYWSDNESVSGPGSTLAYTENIRKELPSLFERYNIKSVFDAPCGDFTWMKEVLKDSPLNYMGGDIVKGIVDRNNEVNETDKIRFIVFDITTQQFPKSDLWLCRDVFFHLSYKDIVSALKQFVASDIPYFLTTTHFNPDRFANTDILTGDFRLIDLFKSPYNFPHDVLHRFEDYIEPHPPREMCLFTREQISQLVNKLPQAFPQ